MVVMCFCRSDRINTSICINVHSFLLVSVGFGLVVIV